MSRIVIIGAGHVGSHVAFALALHQVADEVFLLDIDEKKAQYHAVDIADAVSWMPKHTIVRHCDYSACKDADIIVISIGIARIPGMTRLDLLDQNIEQMDEVIPHIRESGFHGILVGITNPADVIINYAYRNLDLPANHVFSTGTGLDTARLRRCIYEATGVLPANVHAFAMGEHGNSQYAPLSIVKVNGEKLDPKKYNMDWEAVAHEAAYVGQFVIDGKGATEFGIGTTMMVVARAILNDEKIEMPASALLNGEYGFSGIHAGVPCIIGKDGIEKIVEYDLTEEELAGFHKSCNVIKEYVEKTMKK